MECTPSINQHLLLISNCQDEDRGESPLTAALLLVKLLAQCCCACQGLEPILTVNVVLSQDGVKCQGILQVAVLSCVCCYCPFWDGGLWRAFGVESVSDWLFYVPHQHPSCGEEFCIRTRPHPRQVIPVVVETGILTFRKQLDMHWKCHGIECHSLRSGKLD